ncbi:glucose-6-phosphate dehydrogenase, partial [Rhizobium ruizarguesonis]
MLFGATGDISPRKILTGLFHLTNSGFIPGCRINGDTLDDNDADAFRTNARDSLDKFLTRK